MPVCLAVLGTVLVAQEADAQTVFYSAMYRASRYPRKLFEIAADGSEVHWCAGFLVVWPVLCAQRRVWRQRCLGVAAPLRCARQPKPARVRCECGRRCRAYYRDVCDVMRAMGCV